MKSDIDRVEKAGELFEEGYNCCQAVFCAYSDLFGLDFETSLKLSSGFGGGFGRMREVCGAFSAVTMLSGLKRESAGTEDKADIYLQIRNLAEKFKNENGSIICRELLDVESAPKSHIPQERNGEYYKKRPCKEIVIEAAKIVETFI